MKKSKNITKYIPVIFIIIGFLIFLYPTTANVIATINQADVIRQYNDKVETLYKEPLTEEYQKAVNYNLELFNKNTNDESQYTSILNINQDGIMGYIEIPKINVKIPIYHSSSNEVIEKGAGHISKSSFPIAGKNVHSVLTSHTGLRKAKLFTELDKLCLDDIFYITVLDKKFGYKVCDIKTVLPSEIDVLKIVENENLCTLVTCTPYGVNTHRLLVTARLMENEELEIQEKETKPTFKKLNENKNYNSIIVFVIVLLIVIFFVMAKLVKRMWCKM